ncbi:MAG: lipopolysaccharide heptosyltransferase II [candidate division Zixibacteria bacterium]|nr:lipopolysaccharide heptosyltransferase II [candidate division Zixibacteria bacterium]MDD5426331.1 lipopolysaccharide heptosyltransferase II [candidate division Zixibacteria bacterium]
MGLKILIRTPNHLGDCIMAMPMVNETREAYPGSSVTVLVPDYLAELYRQNPAVDEILTIPTRYVHGLIAVMKIKEIIAPYEFDIGYVLPPSFGAASSFKLAGVKESIGYIADGRRLLLSKPLPLPTPLNAEHRSTLYFNLLRRGAGVDLEYVKPKLLLNDDDNRKAVEILDGFGFPDDEPCAVIAFRAVAESRRWGMDNYTRLTRALTKDLKLRVILIGGADDRKEGDRIAEAIETDDIIDEVINLAGKTTLRETAALLSRARIFIGNDSGPAHLAAAVGVPLVVLSGADDPRETSPISSQKKLIYPDHLECISCVKNKCPLKGEHLMRCMKEISVEMVLAAVKELI